MPFWPVPRRYRNGPSLKAPGRPSLGFPRLTPLQQQKLPYPTSYQIECKRGCNSLWPQSLSCALPWRILEVFRQIA
jgi:hypothetical protein